MFIFSTDVYPQYSDHWLEISYHNAFHFVLNFDLISDINTLLKLIICSKKLKVDMLLVVHSASIGYKDSQRLQKNLDGFTAQGSQSFSWSIQKLSKRWENVSLVMVIILKITFITILRY